MKNRDDIKKLMLKGNIILLTDTINNMTDRCEYKCIKCSHIFKTALKFKCSQIKSGGIGCPVCSKKKQISEYIKKDPISGKSKADINAEKSAKTMRTKDSITGLSTYDKTGSKIKNTVNRLNNTGKSLAKIRGEKTQKTKSKVNPKTGKTLYVETAEKSAKTMSINFLNNLKELHKNNFKIFTTIDEYTIDKRISFECKKCSTRRIAYQKYIRCYNCNPISTPESSSMGELELFNFCKSNYTGKVISGDRSILHHNRELDIYIPDLNIAIEYNGSYWHSEIWKDKKYHMSKSTECNNKGIKLLHVFESDWVNDNNRQIWKSIIKNHLGQSDRIYARKTEIRSVSSKDKTEFLDSNHLQGNCSSSVNLGLYLDDELVSLMTFGKSRYDKKIDWELLRFCNKLNTSVIGGAGRLLSRFRKEYTGSIISYSDYSRSVGNLYEMLGFKCIKHATPGYWWLVDGNIEDRWKFQKHMLHEKLEKFDSSKTEIENMHDNGHVRIFNCGNQVWVLT